MTETHLHLTAHLCDGLRYLTPGLTRSVRSGAQTVLVHLTDTGGCAAEPKSNLPAPAAGPAVDRAGVRRALASLVAGDPEQPWADAELSLPHLGAVQSAELRNVRLVFLDLRAADAEQAGTALDALWRGKQETVLTPGGSIRRDELIAALAALIERFTPNVVRLLDPDAEQFGFDDTGTWIRRDDLDHISSALFGLAALQRLREREQPADPRVIECYRARCGERWPMLGPEDTSEQARLLAVAGDGAGDGDGDGETGSAGGAGGLQRFVASTRWLTLDGEGRLLAAMPVAGRIEAWRRPATGSGSWDRVALPALALEVEGCFAPVAEAVTGLDGRVYIFSQHLALAEHDSQHGRGILVCRQDKPGGDFSVWKDLGGTHGNSNRDGMRRRLLGSPSGTVALVDGGVQFFVRNFGTGISSRRQVFGRGWSEWMDLGGSGSDGISAVSALDGTVDVAAPAGKSIRHWTQQGPLGTQTTDEQVEIPGTATALTLADLGDGRVALLTRESSSATVTAYLCPQGNAWTASKPVHLGDVGGYGAVACALSADGSKLALATRSAQGETAYAWWDWNLDAAPVWRTAGPTITGAPSLALDGTGTMVLGVFGTDGALYAGALSAAGQQPDVQFLRVG